LAQTKRNAAADKAEAARAVYRSAIVAALNTGVTASHLARELGTSISRVREDAMRGRQESTNTKPAA
jgi:DNA-directed RNA polymerase specialized sigma24 family protein